MKAASSQALLACAIAAASLLAGSATQVQAQVQEENYRQIVIIMRACAQIEDIGARVTCYDNNIQPGGAAAQPASPVSPMRQIQARGFGAEALTQVQQERRDSRPEELEARVSAAERVLPGIYLVTLEDGAQWQFIDAAPISYEPPRAGSQIRIYRGSLGSFLMRFDGQQGLRVRRVR
ncbi:hypothetical protein GCM10009127_08630 [Alteraurantiacibacter aestuarii]|uniref:Uncharacterized protein n=1 Tax=Alteraurantiacibacter aestuarii TaxID=650004 RepID=A0A844ZIZ6_9SPHN|nr:hypothetical protein [Alteraurantiacibacter aestuarii]MXO87252.1 hypothetical protein [Alteraurantiacibacter aestuarii]